LGMFCKHFRLKPKQLINLGEGKLYNLLLDYVPALARGGRAGSYIHSALKAVKSWLAHNGIEIRRKIKIRGVGDTPTLRDERVPTQQELRRIFLSGDKKTRTACVLVAVPKMTSIENSEELFIAIMFCLSEENPLTQEQLREC